MTQTEHTPGPWVLDSIGDKDTMSCVSSGSGDGHADIAYLSLPNHQANARLIAAAPELLEALEPFALVAKHHAADAPEWGPFDSVQAIISIQSLLAAMEAIAKAKGGAA